MKTEEQKQNNLVFAIFGVFKPFKVIFTDFLLKNEN